LKHQAARILTINQPGQTGPSGQKESFALFRDWHFAAVPKNFSTHGASRIVGSSQQMADLRLQIERFAVTEEPILICGETGTGKELIAELLHSISTRGRGPFVAVNCAAVPDSLAESEFFGAVKGAYTGSVEQRSGLIGRAKTGTLFLDEFGELSPRVQPKLLRALDRGTYRRVGSNREEHVNARIIAATNRDLRNHVQNGGFRADLYHRVNVLSINPPPLREHLSDVPQLVGEILGEILPREVSVRITAAAMAKLVSTPWPGNVRELQNTLRRAFALCNNGVIEESTLVATGLGIGGEAARNPQECLGKLLNALNRSQGRLGPVAEELGVSIRTIQRRMKEHGLRLKDFRVI
jgi:transcriptional regulator with GAF, ATPase, and Fis domain